MIIIVCKVDCFSFSRQHTIVSKYLEENMAAPNSTYKKLAVQWLNGVLFFVSSSVVADSLVLRNRQLLVAAKRYIQETEITLR